MREKTVIIAAQERELLPLLHDRSLGLRSTGVVKAAYRTFENPDFVVVCAGVGGGPAGEAAERAVGRFAPSMMLSVGLAGALTPTLRVGQVIRPRKVVQAGIEYESSLEASAHVLVTSAGIASAQAKRLLARQYSADAVDMESAAVASVAHRHGIPFGAIKAISDTPEFEMPDLEPFIAANGRFQERAFAIHVAFRPRLWKVARELRANSSIAIEALSSEVRTLMQVPAVKAVR